MTAPPASDVDARTVFVRGVSYDASKDDLEAAFGAVGPVRSAFLVGGDAGGGRHRGLGFVQFALPDDAARAVAQLDGSLLKGRKVKVELAHKRASFEDRKKRKRDGAGGDDADGGEANAAPRAPAPRPARPPKPADPAKHALVRTVALGNLTPDTAAAALAAAREAGATVKVTHPAPAAAVEAAKLARDGCAGGVAFVEYDSVKTAIAAVAKLHGATVTAGAGAAPAKKPKKGKATAPPSVLAASTVLWARQVSGEGALLKRWRVIVRNVGFGVGEADLRAALGPVWELNLPRRPDGTPRGFAFAGFTTRAAAEKAIRAVNGLELGGRAVAVDWAVGKAAFEAVNGGGGGAPAADAKAAAAAAAPADAASDDEEGEADDDDDDAGAADVDVGAERALLASVVAGLESDDASAAPAKPAPRGPPAAADKHLDRAAAAAAKIAAATKAAADRLAGGGAAVDGTVFVRGIPADATAGDVRVRLEAFGDVRACRMVMDKASGRPKGTAFVEFVDAAAAARAAAASDAAASGDGRPLTVCGADVRVAVALSKDGARALAAEREAGGKAAGDGRNLYLSREGRVEPGTAAWAALSPADKALRTRVAADAKAKLRLPHYAVSRTRLCVRNLPFSTDEAALKSLLLAAVTARATRATPRIVQVKVLRGARKPGGPVASTGAAFAEFSEHEHALVALRALNNSPAAFGPDRRPVVEFAIDDVRALKKRADARARAKERAVEEKAGKGRSKPATSGEAATPTKGRGKAAADAPATPSAKAGKAKRRGGGDDGAAAAADAALAKRGRHDNGGGARADAAPKKARRDDGGGARADAAPKKARRDDAPAKKPAAAAAKKAAPPPRKKNAAARSRNAADDARDRTDDLIDRYKSKLFGGGAGLEAWV